MKSRVGIQQKAGRLTPAMAVLVSGVLLITGCSDSNTSVGGVTLYKNWQSRGNAPNVVSPAEKESLRAGETYEFRWTGGAGTTVQFHLSRYTPSDPNMLWRNVWDGPDERRNTGLYRTKLPASLPPGLYSANVQTFHNHKICMWASLSGYFKRPKPRFIAYDHPSGAWAMGSTPAEAVQKCNDPKNPYNMFRLATNCKIFDANNNFCRSPAGGEAYSHYFFIGPVNEALFKKATQPTQAPKLTTLYYVEIDNSQSNQAAAAAQSSGSSSSKPSNTVNIGKEIVVNSGSGR